MCKFCEKKAAGDTFGEETIFFEKIQQEEGLFLVNSLQLDPDSKELALVLSSEDGRLDKEFVKSIKYCPFCGREL